MHSSILDCGRFETACKNQEILPIEMEMDGSSLPEVLKNRKVLILQKMGNIGGAEKNLENWIEFFVEKYQFNVSVLGPGEGAFFDWIRKKGFSFFQTQIPDWRKGKNLFLRYIAQKNMLRFIKNEKFDFIFVNDFFYAPYGIYLSRHKKIPIVVHVQSDIEKKRVAQYQLQCTDALILTTHSTFNNVKSIFKDGERTKIRIIPPGVIEKKRNDLDRLSVQKKNFVFGVAANILPHKGIQFFLELLKEIRTQEGWEIHWVGGDVQNLLGGLRDKIEAMNLQDKVFFHGFLDDMSTFYSSINCLIHPAQFEPFGIVMIEAMSYGIPVISTKTAGGIEILGDVDGGRWLVPLDGHREMAEMMLDFIRNPEISFKASPSFFEKYTRNYRREISMEKMEECFSEVLLGA